MKTLLLFLLLPSLAFGQFGLRVRTPERGFPGWGVADENCVFSVHPIAGDMRDWSNSRLTGNITGTVAYVNGAVSNNASSFTNYGTQFENLVSGASAKFTLAVWCKPAVSQPAAIQAAFTMQARCFQIRSISSANKWEVLFSLEDNSHSYQVDSFSGTPPTAGRWTFQVATFDATLGGTGANRTKWYIDGSLDGGSTINDDLSGFNLNPSGTTLQIGASTGVINWQGMIGPTMIFNRVLTDAEVKQLYEASHP